MTATDAAPQVGVSPGTLYGWLMGQGRPMLLPLDAIMLMVGHHYSIVKGARPDAKKIPPAANAGRRRNASNLRRHDSVTDLHPVLVQADALWRESGIPLIEGAAAIGLSRGPVYRWFIGTTPVGLLDLDALLGTIDHRLTVTKGSRRLPAVEKESP